MRSCDRWLVAIVGFALLSMALVQPRASVAQSKEKSDKPDPNEPPTTRLVIHPAEPPAIAMKYRLLPRYLDLVPGNAAVQYLKALPEGGDATIQKHAERIEALLAQDRNTFQLEEARKIVQDFGSTFEFLRFASVREDCDWNLPIREQDWYSVLLPELQSMRQFGRFLALRARVQIADGELENAIETLRVGYVAARNSAQGPTLVNALVGVAIARMMNERLIELMQHPHAPNVYWSIAALPEQFIDVRRAMELEADGVYLMFPQLKDVATAKLTDEQWNMRLAEFSEKLNSFGPIFFGHNERDWKDKLLLGFGMAGMAAVHYPRAKADLESYGWPKEQLDRMAVAQVILLHIGQTYEVFRDEQFKWFHMPYWQAAEGMSAADRSLATNKGREILPLATLLLPAVSSARTALVRLDREFAAMRTVEALRFYAARHKGKLPAKLADIQDVPVPLDPMTGEIFDYKLDGQTATLEGKAPAGQSPETGAFRYVVTVAEKSIDPGAREGRPTERKRDEAKKGQQPEKRAQAVASVIARGLTDVFTTNPIWQVGADRRRAKSINNLMHLGSALANYHDVHKHFPPAASVDKNGKPLLSWRVHVLPFVEEGNLYRQFKLDEPWDSEHNKKLIEKMPDVYRVPVLPPLPKYTTTYLVPVGKETVFHDNKGTPLKEVRDGVSKTIFIVEADRDHAVIWTKPGDWQFDPKEPTRGLGKLRGDRILATFGDSHVSQISPERENDLLPGLFTRAGGETIKIEP